MLQWKIGRSLNPASKECAVEGHPAFTIQNAYAGRQRCLLLRRLRRRLRSSNLKFHRSLGTMNSARCQAKLKRAHAYICICAQLGAWLGTLSWLKVVFFRFVHINIQLQTYQWSGFQAKHILLWEILNV